jgi:phosphoesterase RecJ-like protein
VSTASAAEVAGLLRRERRMVIVAHENPDGDALGSMVALMLMAERLGIEHSAYIPGENGFPREYCFLPRLDEVARGAFPVVGAETSIYILDCATPLRLDIESLRCAGACVNVDHHHDNPGYGTVNLLDKTAASTTQVLYDIFVAGGFPIDAEVGTALYLGLVTDTGRFQYSNTTPAAHLMAAALQEAGVDVNTVYREIYENVPLAKVRLTERALARMQFRLDGRLVISWLEPADFTDLGADESFSEGIIDSLRMVRGVQVAALVRERERNGQREFKGSLRSTDGAVDVSDIAHQRGGGGHVQAAGFTTAGELAEVLDWLERETRARL